MIRVLYVFDSAVFLTSSSVLVFVATLVLDFSVKGGREWKDEVLGRNSEANQRKHNKSYYRSYENANSGIHDGLCRAKLSSRKGTHLKDMVATDEPVQQRVEIRLPWKN